MSHTFEEYREVDNVREKLDFVIDLVNSLPRRVFLTKKGEVLAVVIGAKDYEDLWQTEFDRDMKLADEEAARGELIPHEQVMREIDELQAKLRERR